jgi:hypothetical protein
MAMDPGSGGTCTGSADAFRSNRHRRRGWKIRLDIWRVLGVRLDGAFQDMLNTYLQPRAIGIFASMAPVNVQRGGWKRSPLVFVEWATGSMHRLACPPSHGDCDREPSGSFRFVCFPTMALTYSNGIFFP